VRDDIQRKRSSVRCIFFCGCTKDPKATKLYAPISKGSSEENNIII